MRSLLAALTLILIPSMGVAQNSCPKGNVIAGKRAVKSSKALFAHRLTNNTMASEGTAWNGAHSAILSDETSQVTFDLGQEMQVLNILQKLKPLWLIKKILQL